MAGINLGGGGGVDKTALALEIIKSRAFLESFIEKHQLLVPLMAAEKWDRVTNQLIINKELYDESTGTWLGDVKYPKTAKPSSWVAYKAFLSLLSISQDSVTSLVTIEINHFSPELAKQWLKLIVKDINTFTREQDQKEAQDSIDYLTKKLEQVEVTNTETIFYQLIEEQTKNMMLTQVKAEYVLKTIDPAQVPDIKDSPKRALIVVLGTMLGGILSILIVLIRYFTNSDKTAKPKEGNLA
jgi:uncharacterized protein involved in exopolysaccharide biosynthesis